MINQIIIVKMDFKNKIVWITGGSSGIGEALAHAFKHQGGRIIISSNEPEELERVKKELNLSEENILLLPFDLTKHNEMTLLVDKVIGKFQRIDFLMNCGGVSQRALVKETKIAVDKKIMDINYFGTIALTKAVLPYMLKQKSGNIMVMTSLTGKIGVPMRSAYAASKHALHGFFDTLRAESYRENIKVLLVLASYVKTNMSKNALIADGTPQNKEDASFDKGMTPEYVANKILKAIKKDKKEILMGGKETIGIYIKRFFPNLFVKIIQNHKENLAQNN